MNVTRLVPRAAALELERRGVRCTQVNAVLWRLTRADGRVAAYLESLDDLEGPSEPLRAIGEPAPRRAPDRFLLKRMNADRRGFTELGRVRDLDEAIDLLRYASAS